MSINKKNLVKKEKVKVDEILPIIREKYGDIKTRTIEIQGKKAYLREPNRQVLSKALTFFLDQNNPKIIEAGETIFNTCLLKEVSDKDFLDNEAYIISACISCGRIFEDYVSEDAVSIDKDVKTGVDEILKKYNVSSVSIITCGDKKAYLKPINRQTIQRALLHLMDVKNPKMVEAGETILKESIINEYSHEDFLTDDKTIFMSSFKCCELIQIFEADLKKNY